MTLINGSHEKCFLQNEGFLEENIFVESVFVFFLIHLLNGISCLLLLHHCFPSDNILPPFVLGSQCSIFNLIYHELLIEDVDDILHVTLEHLE